MFPYIPKTLKVLSRGRDIIARKVHAKNHRVIEDTILCKGQGVRVWDKNGKEYLDFIGGHGSLSLGHCHHEIIAAIQEQMCTLHQTTQSLRNALLPEYCTLLCDTFNYDQVICLNTGNEAAEMAVKLARLWGYKEKKICPKDAVVVFAHGNHWGHSLAAISTTSNPFFFRGFEPLLRGLKLIPYNDTCTLSEALRAPNVCGFMVEGIQAENNVRVPSEGYLTETRRLCTQNRVLWIGDETWTGLGRTGAMLSVDHECAKPDVLCLGKSLGGGYYPMSAVLASDEVMNLMKPGIHETTWGGNVLGCKIAMQTLKVIKNDSLVDNSQKMGTLLRQNLLCALSKDDMPVLRGKGLLTSFKIDHRIGSAQVICEHLRDCGLLAWPGLDDFIRLSPPLIVTEDEVIQAVDTIKKVVSHLRDN